MQFLLTGGIMRFFLFALACTLSIFSYVKADNYSFPDPYPEVYYNIKPLPPLVHGWHRHEKQVKDIFAKKQIQTVIEVGVWLGNWTLYVAGFLPDNGKIFAVDHWKGSPEHQQPGFFENTLLPTLYQQFLSNVIFYGFTNKIIPVRMDSLQASAKLNNLKIKADLIYIDAGHDYNSVLNDIAAWYPLLNEGGVFCGDDWNLGDVSKAVRAYQTQKGLRLCVEGEFWWYEKP